VNELAFDTATTACVVALRRADGELFEHRPPAARLREQPAHTTELLPAIVRLADGAGITLGEIDRVAVGVGPGAFTGLRIGVASARAIATANGCRLVAFSSLAALAGTAHSPLLDARRGEFYFRVDGVDRLAGPDAAVAALAAAGLPVVGEGALVLRGALIAAGLTVPPDDAPDHVATAAALLAAAAGGEPLEPAVVVPNYIRPPDAKVSARASWLAGSGR
jgi:tRNA threonylcarbamoyladenosine biosynthesis protein TsaB